MNNNKYTFWPPIKREVRLNQFTVEILSMTLFEKVTVVAHIFDENENLQDNKFYTLEGDDYKAWSTDDTYIIQYVKTKLQEERQQLVSQNVVSVMKSKVKAKNGANGVSPL